MQGNTRTDSGIHSSLAESNHKRIAVLKFGGTSLASHESRLKAVEHIRKRKDNGFATVVVVSAIGRNPEPYATDTLINLITGISSSPNPAIKDLLMSCGEVISACIVGQLLENAGFSVTVIPWQALGIITDRSFGDALPRLADVTRVHKELSNGKIAVLPGFQGNTPDGDITTLGRGGSDFTAVAVGAALGAETVDIFTDVDGVKTADPDILPDALTLNEITYEEMGELAHHGAKVIHSKAAAFASQERVPLTIRSTAGNVPGTQIVHKLSSAGRVVTGIAHVFPVAFVKINLLDKNPCQTARLILDAFAASNISLDMIHISKEQIYFIFKEELMPAGRAILKDFSGASSMEGGYAKVSVVGAGMRGVPGIMMKMIDALHNANIPLYHSTDSHITISCLVPQSDLKNAVIAIANKFNLTGESYVE